MGTKEKLAELKQKVAEAKKQVEEMSKDAFKEMSTEVFTNHPIVAGFEWRQYTPYFNDGEPCVFGARTDEPTMFFVKDGVETEVDGWEVPSGRKYNSNTRKFDEVVLEGEEKSQNSAYEATRGFLSNFDDEDFKMMFGDHVRVAVRPTGIAIEECDHD